MKQITWCFVVAMVVYANADDATTSTSSAAPPAAPGAATPAPPAAPAAKPADASAASTTTTAKPAGAPSGGSPPAAPSGGNPPAAPSGGNPQGAPPNGKPPGPPPGGRGPGSGGPGMPMPNMQNMANVPRNVIGQGMNMAKGAMPAMNGASMMKAGILNSQKMAKDTLDNSFKAGNTMMGMSTSPNEPDTGFSRLLGFFG